METPFSAPVERILKAYAVHTGQDSPPSVAESRNPPVFGPRLLLKTGDRKQVMRRLYTGKAPLVVEPTSTGAIVYHYDPSRPDSGTVRAAIDNILQEKSGRTNPVATSDDTQVEPGSRYIDFLIPGLIGVNTMGGGLWGIGFLIVNFRIGKLLKCFVATPMPRKDSALRCSGARMTFLIPDLTVLLLVGTLMFGVPIRGSLFLVVVLDVLGALAFAGIGLLVGSRATTTETVSGLMNLVMLPMWIRSASSSSERFPDAVQPLIKVLPLTQLLNSLRAVILEAAGWFDVLPAILILTAWAVITFVIALRISDGPESSPNAGLRTNSGCWKTRTTSLHAM